MSILARWLKRHGYIVMKADDYDAAARAVRDIGETKDAYQASDK